MIQGANFEHRLEGVLEVGWHLQSNNVCIPDSSNPEHIREEADVFGFALSADEMAAIDALDRNQRFASY